MNSVVDEGTENLNDTINWAAIPPEEFASLFSERVIYKADDIIAFDKPAGVAYSGSKSTHVQIDRVLQDVKKLVADDCQRLCLVESLDKCSSGVIIFAKSLERQKQLKAFVNDGKVIHRFRVIVRGVPEKPAAEISIPLHKKMNGLDVRWLPVRGRTSGPVCYDTTRYKLVNYNDKLSVSLLDVFTNRSSGVHQIRSHLSFGINCPLLGEAKYNSKNSNVPIKVSQGVLEASGIKNDRKLPMLIHLSEVLIPMGIGSRFSVIKAGYPLLFTKFVKSLSLFKK